MTPGGARRATMSCRLLSDAQAAEAGTRDAATACSRVQLQNRCKMNCVHSSLRKGCAMRRAKAAQETMQNRASGLYPLASKQASEDVVGGANTTFGGATRALGARRGASNLESVYCGHLPGSARVSPRAKDCAGRCSNSGRSSPGAAEESRAARGCQPVAPPHGCQEAKADAPSARASRTLDSRAAAAPPP